MYARMYVRVQACMRSYIRLSTDFVLRGALSPKSQTYCSFHFLRYPYIRPIDLDILHLCVRGLSFQVPGNNLVWPDYLRQYHATSAA